MFNPFIVLDVLLIFFILYLIVRPIPLKYLLISCTNLPKSEPKIDEAVGKIEHFYVDKFKATLYSNASGKNNKLLVFVQGGAFLTCDIETTYALMNEFAERLSEFDVVTFDYGVRFSYTIQNMVQHVYKIIQKCREFRNYTILHGIGMSAGSLIIGAMQTCEYKNLNDLMRLKDPSDKNNYKFETFTSLCGLLNTTFRNSYLDFLFRNYLLRKTPASVYYTCYDLPELKKFIISSQSEYLKHQSIEFVAKEKCQYEIYSADFNLTHTFPLFTNINKTQECIENVVKFIRSV
ncbi:gp19-like protein [Phenacoccus solenopsis nudivirus]|nr:gp19-like protein [Phenacoccus solenopsis nudivirus]